MREEHFPLSQFFPPSFGTSHKAALGAVILLAILAGILTDRYLLAPSLETAEEHHEEEPSGVLKLSAERIRLAGIRTLKVEAGSAASQVIAQATVAATPEGAAIIGARADGTVTRISKRLGDPVTKGEIIGAIQSREAARLAEERAAAQARLVRAEQAFVRQKNLIEASATSRQDYEAAQSEWKVAQAELARARLSGAASGLSADGISLDVTSPVSGRITSATAVLGAYVVAGTELFRVADPARLEVQAAVPSADAQRIAVGDRALIATAEGDIAATVRAITPDVNLESRAATVVLVPKDSHSLRPGQYVSARIKVEHGHTDAGTVLLPSEAVQKIEGADAVYVRTKTGFQVRAIIAGTENGGMTEVRSGLRPGEVVASTNAFLLKAEQQKGSAGHDD